MKRTIALSAVILTLCMSAAAWSSPTPIPGGDTPQTQPDAASSSPTPIPADDSIQAQPDVASSSPTPIPGGANQAAGVAGTFGQRLFNGEIRLLPRNLRDASDSDGLMAATGKKWIIFTASASNGTAHALDMQQFVASIADADGDTLQAQPDKVKPMGGVFGEPPGGQWKEQVMFDVPVDFVPVKIVLLPYDRKHQAFRITVRPADYAHS